MRGWLVLALLIGGMVAADELDRQAFFATPDFAAEPPNVRVLSEKTEDGVVTRELYVSGGTFNGEPSEIYAWYSRPVAAGKYPGVVQLHGAGLRVLGPEASIFYAKNGFCCISPDWAGPSPARTEPFSHVNSPGRMARQLPEGERAQAPPHGWRSFGRDVDNIRNGVRFVRRCAMFLRAREEVDGDRLCLSGMSAGAHLSLLVLGLEPAFKAAAVKYGTGFIDDIRFGGYYGPMVMTNRTEQESWLAAFDPKHGIRDYRASVLLLSGTNDIFFWMPAVLQTYRAIPTDKRLIMRPNDNHTQVGNHELPLAYFQSVLGMTTPWPAVTPLTATVADGQLTLRTTAAAAERVDIIIKRQPKADWHWGPRKEAERSAAWQVVPAVRDGDAWTLTVPAPGEDEQLVAYATATDAEGRQVSTDTVEFPDYPSWRGRVAYEPWEKVFKALDFQRCELADPAKIADIRRAGNLSGRREGDKWQSITGWFEYDFWTPHSGWYELIVPQGGDTEFTVNGEYAFGARDDKVGNFYLDKGRYTIRLQRWHWTGLRPIDSFTLRAVAPDDDAGHLRATLAEDRTVYRLGEDLRVRVQSGRLTRPLPLDVELVIGDEVVASATLELPDWPSDEVRFVSLPCARAGRGVVRFRLDGKDVDPADQRPLGVDVMDTTPPAAVGGEVARTLVQEIDCATTAPDYANGETRVVETPFGAYRESGAVGWLAHMNDTDPTWLAYTLTVPDVQVPYQVEVDYPDDALRTFCIAIREGVPGAYPSTGGVDSGGEWPLSRTMLTHSILYWPRSTDLRLLLIPALDGRRAAAARVRVYRVDGDLPLLPTPRTGGRHFANWYEEGSNFRGVYGGSKNHGPNAVDDMVLADRWARTMRSMGSDTLWMTMVVYQFGLYPSRYNVNFGGPYSADLVGKAILACERYGMDFIGEFHPEARELDWPLNADPARLHRALNRNGQLRTMSTEPIYNPLWPANREWYLGMIGEFVDRYAASPALKGVCLRTMTWVNPGLCNFHSLDWGYDDYTIGQFVADTGTEIPVDAGAADRFRQRYDWLMANARDAWVDWRCDRIADLYRQVVARVRQARPDLAVLTGVNIGNDPRDAGLDPAKLAAVDGLVLIKGGSYGRRQGNELAVQAIRDGLLDPASLHAGVPADQRLGFLIGAGYFEATEKVVPPPALGYAEKTPATWMSGVVNPAGRHCLERWAVALAETDTSFLADGGNAYTVGQPLLRDWLAEYRNLPALPFAARPDARDPAAVWTRDVRGYDGFADGFYFYAVNRERYPVTLRLTLTGAPEVVHLADGKPTAAGAPLTVTLAPYELRAFRAPVGAAIAGVAADVPAAAREHAAALVAFLENLATATDLPVSLRPEQQALLKDRAKTAREALDAGHLWRARTMIEHHDLRAIYNRVHRQPPNLRDLGNPVAPEGAMLPNDLQQRLRQGAGQVRPSRELVPTWVGEELLVSTDPVLEFALDAPVDALNGIAVGRVAGGEYGDLEVAVNGTVIGTLRDTGDIRGVVSLPDTLALLRPGEARLTLRRLNGSAMALRYLQIDPVYTDIVAANWRAAGPYMVGDRRELGKEIFAAIQEAMAKPAWQPVETDRQAATWVPLAVTGDFIDFGRTFDRALGCISYAMTHIQSPAPARVRLRYGMDYWMKIWLNGDLVQDLAPHGGAPFKGQFTVDVPLVAGANELLVKVASGSLGNGFWLAVSDPGTLRFGP